MLAPRLRHNPFVRRGRFFVSITTSILGGCAALLGADFDHPAQSSDAGHGGRGDAVSSQDATAEAEATEECKGEGARAIRIRGDAGSWCIDATETTRAQYAVFVGSVSPITAVQPSFCNHNETFLPSRDWEDSPHDDRPVTFVDFCDAYMYCTWAHKRLCRPSEWSAACTRDGARIFPYGDVYEPSRCNGRDLDAGGPIAVASRTGCEGAYTGVFDMSGNVFELVDGCGPGPDAGPEDDACLLRGGSWAADGPSMQCAATFLTPRNQGWNDVGFRCCSLE